MNDISNSTQLIKTANSHLVLNAIRKLEAVTISDIIHTTHLSRPTVLNIIDDLLKRNIISEVGFAESNVGRRPVLYAINNNTYFSIGIDFEFPPVHLIVTDLSGNIRYQKNWNCSFDTRKDDIIQSLLENIQLAMDTLQITLDNIIGIGLGIPGTVNIERNTSEIISRIPQWNKLPLNKIIHQHFPVPIYVRNDAHLISLAKYDSLLSEESDFIYVSYRTGIGMAIIQNGKLNEGSFGNSGYIGHTTVDINGDLCNCGNRGCLETFVSKMAIENKYAQAKNLDKRIPFDVILALANNDDPIAINILENGAMYFGMAIANSVKILDIHTVVIDDLNCREDHIFVKQIEQTVNHFCSSYSVEPIKVIPHRNDAGEYALGAALFVLDTFFEEPKLKLSV